ncbi:bifunctional (p)ppGpp synthetase/guanosine-3',5'-bis(diphosphate) 3'-pyrophosphohydrolase [Leeia sp. TBRC 13508]|uniref:GTP pyrophosphokinase n=1 Tax=Leeia speluncae TaxID=2884804 RepID=A0ABS8D815_9NEIS|nr:bifunctional (p)ppGpp synthetase/guanosine-3',5'-bis(diphosphate) 3'-pyrophosphohydrolase [Leeia speluncae]MCB6183783.1 bifunctional (p)ppGpp synthetase/guanosine-3',5'-bis(diphosphate) 3'-pyrophosphohydrolase [Leeia speluncae]
MVSVAHPLANPDPHLPDNLLDELDQICARFEESEQRAIRAAAEVVRTIYADRLNSITNLPLLQHAIATAVMVADLKLDYHAVCATLLFATPDYLVNWEENLADFGAEVEKLIDGINKVRQLPLLAGDHLTDPKLATRQIEIMRKMMLAMVEDVRVVLIKLCWRTQTMHGLKYADPENQTRVARETMDLFAPLANRLGVWQVKWELEDLSFRYLEPIRYKKIAQLLDEKRMQREAYIQEVLDVLRNELAAAGIEADVAGRPKHIYSIWRKMQKKRLEFSELYDIRAVRILVKSIKDCYTVLGIVHHLWRPIHGQFDDYISHPKGNFYRSLHTAVVGPHEKGMEVQIRTFEMHQHAEMGVAAHWRYKEGGHQDNAYEEKIAWLRQLLAWREEISKESANADTQTEMAEQFKNELFQDTVYVLTPQGRVIDLPEGASPIDFAYHLHTDLGHRCRGAKVNGHIVPLSYALQNGDRVEILAAKEGGPSLDWLRQGMLKSSRAIAKVRQWLKQQHQDVLIEHGKQVFDKTRQKYHPGQLDQERVAEKLGFKKPDELFAALGRGEIGPKALSEAMLEIPQVTQTVEVTAEGMVRESRTPQNQQGILIEGVDNLMTLLAKCCKPVKGDPVIGFVTRGRGISIHRQGCKTLERLAAKDEERLISANWGVFKEGRFPVDIIVEATDRPGLLRDVSEAFSRDKCYITAAQTLSRNTEASLRFTVEITDHDQLRQVLSHLASVPGVTKAMRRHL